MSAVSASQCARRTLSVAGSVLLLLGATPARAGFFDVNVEKACPAAVAEEAALAAQRPHRTTPASITRPALLRELQDMERRDQDAREQFVRATNAGEGNEAADPAVQALLGVDAQNLVRLKHIITQDGFPTLAMVGTEGVDAAFLLIQHADADRAFQARMLTVITARLHAREIDGKQYALLTDRVLVAQHRPQRYGTQFTSEAGAPMKPDLIADERHVDARRHALGLVSMKNYTCILHAVYDPH